MTPAKKARLSIAVRPTIRHIAETFDGRFTTVEIFQKTEALFPEVCKTWLKCRIRDFLKEQRKNGKLLTIDKGDYNHPGTYEWRKPCAHPKFVLKVLETPPTKDTFWCRSCGALWENGHWTLPDPVTVG